MEGSNVPYGRLGWGAAWRVRVVGALYSRGGSLTGRQRAQLCVWKWVSMQGRGGFGCPAGSRESPLSTCAVEVDSGPQPVSLPGACRGVSGCPACGWPCCAAPRGPPLTLPCVVFTFSTAPLTTAWTPGRWGFTACITQTRANGEKAQACSGGSLRPGWVGGGRPQGPGRFPLPKVEKEPLSPPSWKGAQPEERGALPVKRFSRGHRALT